MTAFGPFLATVTNIHDGDTLTVDVLLHADHRWRGHADVDLGFGVHIRSGVGIVLEGQRVRLLGCNAPELATVDGRQALAYLETLVKVGDPVKLVSHSWDKYGGRIDGTIALSNGVDVTQAMIAAGHAAAWDGKGAKPVPPSGAGA